MHAFSALGPSEARHAPLQHDKPSVPRLASLTHSLAVPRLALPCVPCLTRRAVAEMQALRASISMPHMQGPPRNLKAQQRWQSAVKQVNTMTTLSPASKKRVRKKPDEERGMPRTVSLPSLALGKGSSPVKSSGLIHSGSSAASAIKQLAQ